MACRADSLENMLCRVNSRYEVSASSRRPASYIFQDGACVLMTTVIRAKALSLWYRRITLNDRLQTGSPHPFFHSLSLSVCHSSFLSSCFSPSFHVFLFCLLNFFFLPISFSLLPPHFLFYSFFVLPFFSCVFSCFFVLSRIFSFFTFILLLLPSFL